MLQGVDVDVNFEVAERDSDRCGERMLDARTRTSERRCPRVVSEASRYMRTPLRAGCLRR